jgi:hypothetical protein
MFAEGPDYCFIAVNPVSPGNGGLKQGENNPVFFLSEFKFTCISEYHGRIP